MSQPRTELNFEPIYIYYKIAKTLKQDMIKVNRFVVGEIYEKKGYAEDLENLVVRSSVDTFEAIQGSKNSNEFRRLNENKYTNNKIENIPLSKIIHDLKKCNSTITKYEIELDKILKFSNNKSELSSLNEKMTRYFQVVINYYSFRIGILSKYLQYAKASLGAFVDNICGNSEEIKANTKYVIPKKVSKTFPEEEFKEVTDKIYAMRTCDAEDYTTYRKHYEKFCELMSGSDDIIIKGLFISEKNRRIDMKYIKDDGNKIPISSQTLFHASDNETLTELKPSFRSKDGRIFFPTPRIYFHINMPLNRYGSTVQHLKTKSDTCIYQCVSPVSKAKCDKELGKTAVFVETFAPIKIKKVEYEQIIKTEEDKIDLEFNM